MMSDNLSANLCFICLFICFRFWFWPIYTSAGASEAKSSRCAWTERRSNKLCFDELILAAVLIAYYTDFSVFTLEFVIFAVQCATISNVFRRIISESSTILMLWATKSISHSRAISIFSPSITKNARELMTSLAFMCNLHLNCNDLHESVAD